MLRKKILIIEDTNQASTIIKELFPDEMTYDVISCENSNEQIKNAMQEIPDVILINCVDNLEVYKSIGGDGSNFMTPTIVFATSPTKEDVLAHLSAGIDYYIIKPIDKEYLFYTVKNVIRLLYNNRTVSPLTGLPGNIQITNELKRRLLRKNKFYVLYIDLDNFKAYNDTYGFLKGDEVIKLTANVMVNAIREYGVAGDFVGHIGGDDFVAITSSEKVDTIAGKIIEDFDREILGLLSHEDIERGVFEVPNRKGIIEQFPLTAVSIAGVAIRENDNISILEIGEVGAQVKHKVKAMVGSSYYLDRRTI